MPRVNLLDSSTDEDLAKRAQGGDREAERILILRLYPGVHVLAVRLLRHEEAARDATQEAFLRAFSRIDQYDASYRFSTWVFKILVNIIRDEYRRGAQIVAAPLEPDDWPAHEPVPIDVAIQEENFRLVRSQLDRLPEDMRMALLLHFQEGLPGREIAFALGISYDAARLKISRAVAKLREWCGEG